MKALEAHFKASHMVAFQRALGGIQPKSMDAKVYEVGRELALPNG